MLVKKKELTKGQYKYIENLVIRALEGRNLKSWQQVCASLAPPKYNNTTRSKWFEENKYRASIGREIVEFVDETCKKLQQETAISNVLVSEIRSGVVKGIRRAEILQHVSKYLLNDVKLATLKTIVSWVDYPNRVAEVGVTKQDSTRRKFRKGRKAEKGKYVPPEVNLIKEWEIIDKTTIRITAVLLNKYLHPYQNVELQVEIDPKLILTNVSPYSWLPEDHLIRIGCLQAGFDIEPYETPFVLDFRIRQRATSYKFSWRVHYDNCERGIRDVSEMSTTTITLSH
jgi:hypothetical protein